MQWAISQIVDTVDNNFHGEVVLVFKAGVLQCLKTEKVAKPPQTV